MCNIMSEGHISENQLSLLEINTEENLPFLDISDHFSQDKSIILNYSDAQDFLKTIPTNSIMLTITSPPYNIGKEYELETSLDEYLEKQRKIISEVVRVTHERGNICWQVGNYLKKGQREILPLDIYFYNLFKEHDLQLRNRIIWHFGHGLHASKRFSGRYETILWFTKSNNYIFNLDSIRVPAKYPGKRHYKGKNKGKPSGNPLGKNPSDVWEFLAEEWEKEIWEIPNVKANHTEKTIHPCQFPVELVERCLLALTNENDFILDPYCGVGSSLIAGIKNHRKVIGCDYHREYINIAKDRITKFQKGELKIRPIGKSIHKPSGKEKVTQVPEEWRGEEGDLL